MAWAPTNSYATLVSGWPSRMGSSSNKEKVPSALVYRESPGAPLWGYQVASPDGAIKWFKLLLLDGEDLPDKVRSSDHLKTAARQLRDSNRHAVEVVGDYLRELWGHGLKDMRNALGRERLAASRLELVVTLPAIWPQYARHRMREAVERAGLLEARTPAGDTTLSFVSEPEAAGLATMEDFSNRVAFKVRRARARPARSLS